MSEAFSKQSKICVEVQDRGTGIPAQFQGRIFERFAQAESSSARRFEGTGLGLHITRSLVHAMWGTTFRFELPFLTEASGHLDALLPSPAGSYRTFGRRHDKRIPRVLHMEDDVDLREMIRAALEGKAQIVGCSTLDESRALLRREKFDLMLADVNMPDGSGLSVLDLLDTLESAPGVIVFSISEVPPAVRLRVQAVCVKSRISERQIVSLIEDFLARERAPRLQTSSCATDAR